MESLTQTIKNTYPHIFTTTVHKSGELVFEMHKSGYKNRVRTTRSITKSVISTLYGIAIHQGYLKSLDEKVISYFPEYWSEHLDAKVQAVSIRHLLSMTSGFDCTDRHPKGFFRSKNWTKFYLERKIIHDPGSKFHYSSASSHLLSALLYKLTSLNVYDFAKINLFAPLGITQSNWSYDQQGYYHGGFGLDLSADSIRKIGRLHLDGGVVAGKRIISQEYLAEATSFQVAGGFPENDGYGYHWWVGSSSDINYYYAAGLGGQYLFIVPDLELIVTITSDSRRPHSENKQIFIETILPYFALGDKSKFTAAGAV